MGDHDGVMHYHNPDLVEQLAHTAPEASLIEMIDAELFRHENAVWIGSAIQLESKLCDQGSQMRDASTEDSHRRPNMLPVFGPA
jgi:hypothetical protein